MREKRSLANEFCSALHLAKQLASVYMPLAEAKGVARCPGWSHRFRRLVPWLGSVRRLIVEGLTAEQKQDQQVSIREPASAHESHSSFAASCGPDRCRFDSFASRLQ